jgi:hypothetical protein
VPAAPALPQPLPAAPGEPPTEGAPAPPIVLTPLPDDDGAPPPSPAPPTGDGLSLGSEQASITSAGDQNRKREANDCTPAEWRPSATTDQIC